MIDDSRVPRVSPPWSRWWWHSKGVAGGAWVERKNPPSSSSWKGGSSSSSRMDHRTGDWRGESRGRDIAACSTITPSSTTTTSSSSSSSTTTSGIEVLGFREGLGRHS